VGLTAATVNRPRSRRSGCRPSSDGRPRGSLPAERAFVVQLRADADFGSGAVAGRVEHMSSGAAALFDSFEQLIAWLRDIVDRTATQSHE